MRSPLPILAAKDDKIRESILILPSNGAPRRCSFIGAAVLKTQNYKLFSTIQKFFIYLKAGSSLLI